MTILLKYTLFAIVGLVLLLGAAFGYFIYSPAPDLPRLSASVQEKSIQVGGRTRTYSAYVPARLPTNPAIVLVLHGSMIDGATMRAWTGFEFDELADQHGFVVLYPDGYKNNWNDCRKDAPFAAKKENIDDVGFLRALVKQYESTNGVDSTKVFAFGYSNGGQMAFRLSIEQPRFVAAIAAIAANMPIQESFGCNGQGPTPPVMLVSNTADAIMPYNGGEVKLLGTSHGLVLSSRATANHFAHRNNLTQSSKVEVMNNQTGSHPLPVERLTWSQAGRIGVDWYTVRGGGHVIPQPRFQFGRINGLTATNLDTPAQAVAFFGLTR